MSVDGIASFCSKSTRVTERFSLFSRCIVDAMLTSTCCILFTKVSQLNENCCMLLLNTLTLHHCQDLGVIVSTNVSWTKTNNVITKNHTESLISFAAAFSYSNKEAPLINFFETHLLLRPHQDFRPNHCKSRLNLLTHELNY